MKSLILSLILTTTFAAHAAEVFETHNTVRGLGMGGLLLTVVNNQDALFVNPAALSKVQGINVKLLNVEVGTNGYQLYQDLQGIDLSTPSSYNQLFGKDIWIRAAGSAAVAIPNFAVGAYSENSTSMVLHNPGFPQFQTHFVSDYGMMVGGSFPIGPATSFGIAAKQVVRRGGDQDIDLGVIAGGHLEDIADQFQNVGRAYGFDVGMITTLPAPFSPTVSLSWQDVGSTAFALSSGTDAPPRIHDNLSLGVSTSIDLPGLDWMAGFEYRHITESEYQIGQKLHLGTEVSLPFVDLRAGLNQGYLSYGAGFNFFFMRFDVATYTEEMGVYPGQTPQDRIQVGLTLELSFDADFKLTNSEGKRRKLKQRR